MTTTRVEVMDFQWTDLGPGPMIVEAKAIGAVRIAVSDVEPVDLTASHILDGGDGSRRSLRIASRQHVWARAKGALVTVVVVTSEQPAVSVVSGLAIPEHDYVACGYTGSDLTTVTYRLGGQTGPIVGTMHMTYNAAHAVVSAWMELP